MRPSEAFFGLRLHEQQKYVWTHMANAIFEVGNEDFDIRYAEPIIELEAQ